MCPQLLAVSIMSFVHACYMKVSKARSLREIEFGPQSIFQADKVQVGWKVRQPCPTVTQCLYVCVYPVSSVTFLLLEDSVRHESGVQPPKRKVEQLLTAVGSALHADTCVHQVKTWCVPITPERLQLWELFFIPNLLMLMKHFFFLKKHWISLLPSHVAIIKDKFAVKTRL